MPQLSGWETPDLPNQQPPHFRRVKNTLSLRFGVNLLGFVGDVGMRGRQPAASYGKALRLSAVAAGCLALANCGSSDKLLSKVDPKYGVSASPRVVELGQAVPKGGGTYRVGRPYVVAGRTYFPEEDPRYRAEGLASWYGEDFHGRLTANGEIFDMESISAAHPTLPIPSYARVTNVRNGRSIIVRVNDRGPYHGNRLIDVSHKAAHLLDFRRHGTARVRVEYVGRAPLEGTDDRQLQATLRQGEPAPAPSRVMVASARPFVPDFGSPVAGRAPMPPERPYALGQGMGQAQVQQASATDTTAMARADSRRPPHMEAAAAPLPSSPSRSPISAFAPTRYDGSSGVMSGRGLY